MMDQQKMGLFIKRLRKEKSITQEQLSEILGVTNRSVSRWENGVNLPDLGLLIDLAKCFDVGVEELLDGERKGVEMDRDTEKAVLKVADYSNQEKNRLAGRMLILFVLGLIAVVAYGILQSTGKTDLPVYDNAASFLLGGVCGVLVLGIIYTGGLMPRMRAIKLRLLKRNN